MKELVRKHYMFSSGGHNKKVRILKDPGDILEGVLKFLKAPTVIFLDKNWHFTITKMSEEDGMLFYVAEAVSDDGERSHYDFAVDAEDDELVFRFKEAASFIIGEEVMEIDN